MARRPHALPPVHVPSAANAILSFSLMLLAAAPTGAAGAEIILRHGEGGGGHYERSGIGLRLGPLWSTEWGGWSAQLRPELELSHFRYTGPAPAAPDGLTQGGAIAHFRAVRRGSDRLRPYAEAGLGLSLFSNDRLGEKAFSTHFQFSQHLGLGVRFAKSGFAGYQYSHYSNGDIDLPNSGIDLHQLVVGVDF
jgi:opacity protein-like surface antigen